MLLQRLSFIVHPSFSAGRGQPPHQVWGGPAHRSRQHSHHRQRTHRAGKHLHRVSQSGREVQVNGCLAAAIRTSFSSRPPNTQPSLGIRATESKTNTTIADKGAAVEAAEKCRRLAHHLPWRPHRHDCSYEECLVANLTAQWGLVEMSRSAALGSQEHLRRAAIRGSPRRFLPWLCPQQGGEHQGRRQEIWQPAALKQQPSPPARPAAPKPIPRPALLALPTLHGTHKHKKPSGGLYSNPALEVYATTHVQRVCPATATAGSRRLGAGSPALAAPKG